MEDASAGGPERTICGGCGGGQSWRKGGRGALGEGGMGVSAMFRAIDAGLYGITRGGEGGGWFRGESEARVWGLR